MAQPDDRHVLLGAVEAVGTRKHDPGGGGSRESTEDVTISSHYGR